MRERGTWDAVRPEKQDWLQRSRGAEGFDEPPPWWLRMAAGLWAPVLLLFLLWAAWALAIRPYLAAPEPTPCGQDYDCYEAEQP